LNDPLPPTHLAAACEARLAVGHAISLVTRGISMHPFLRTGDLVRIEALPPRGPALGDLVAFRRDGEVVVHRCAGRRTARIREKGDNLRDATWIPREALLGWVVEMEGPGGTRILAAGPGRWRNRCLGARAWCACALRPFVLALRSFLVARCPCLVALHRRIRRRGEAG
jgi:hypothetical protein